MKISYYPVCKETIYNWYDYAKSVWGLGLTHLRFISNVCKCLSWSGISETSRCVQLTYCCDVLQDQLHGGPSFGPVRRHIFADVGTAPLGAICLQHETVSWERRIISTIGHSVERALSSAICECGDCDLHCYSIARKASGCNSTTRPCLLVEGKSQCCNKRTLWTFWCISISREKIWLSKLCLHRKLSTCIFDFLLCGRVWYIPCILSSGVKPVSKYMNIHHRCLPVRSQLS